MAIRIPLGMCVVLMRRKGERIPTSGFALLGMTEVGVGGVRRVLYCAMSKKALSIVHALGAPLRGAVERKRD